VALGWPTDPRNSIRFPCSFRRSVYTCATPVRCCRSSRSAAVHRWILGMLRSCSAVSDRWAWNCRVSDRRAWWRGARSGRKPGADWSGGGTGFMTDRPQGWISSCSCTSWWPDSRTTSASPCALCTSSTAREQAATSFAALPRASWRVNICRSRASSNSARRDAVLTVG